MAKAKKSSAPAKKSKRGAHLVLWNQCWKEIGVCPLTDKITQKHKDQARACVDRKKKVKKA
jgi:hypothetical protein